MRAGALLAAVALCATAATTLTSTGAVATPDPERGAPVQLVTLELEDGDLRVVAATAADVGLPASLPRAARAKVPSGEVVVEVLGRDGEVTYRRSVAVASQIRAEFPVAGGTRPSTARVPLGTVALTVALPAGPGARVRVVTPARTSTTATLRAPARAAGGLEAEQPELVEIPGYGLDDSTNRLDLVILGDGYTAEDRAAFVADAQRLADGVLAISPYAEYAGLFNVVGVFAPSAERGADHPAYAASAPAQTTHPISGCRDATAPGTARYADTRYDSSYCYAGIQRLLVPIDQGRAFEDATAAYPGWDALLMLVNDPEYGGSGGPLATSSLDRYGVEVLRHELGHSLLELDDEYAVFTPGYPPCSDTGRAGIRERCAANVTDATERAALKWRHWVSDATPIPTTGTQPPTVVGLFEGAHYSADTWYRSCHSCLMKDLGTPFGPVAAEALPARLYSGGWQGPGGTEAGRLSLIEPGTAVPDQARVEVASGSAQEFSVQVVGPSGAHTRVEWRVDGTVVRTGTLASGAVDRHTLVGDGAAHTVTVEATDVAGILHPSRVRESLASRTWRVVADDAPGTPLQLLRNGSFEKPLSTGWRTRNVPASARVCVGAAPDGRCVLRLSAARGQKRLLDAAEQPVLGTTGPGRLTLSGAFDPANLRAALAVTARVRTADGGVERLEVGRIPVDRKGRAGFVRRTVVLDLASPPVGLDLRLALGKGSGRVRIDAMHVSWAPAG